MSAVPLYNKLNRRTGICTTLERDDDTGLLVFKRHQNLAGIVEFNRQLAAIQDRHAARARRLRGNSNTIHVAEIPMVIWLRLEKLGITKDDKALKKWLSQREARAFRCDDGRKLA